QGRAAPHRDASAAPARSINAERQDQDFQSSRHCLRSRPGRPAMPVISSPTVFVERLPLYCETRHIIPSAPNRPAARTNQSEPVGVRLASQKMIAVHTPANMRPRTGALVISKPNAAAYAPMNPATPHVNGAPDLRARTAAVIHWANMTINIMSLRASDDSESSLMFCPDSRDPWGPHGRAALSAR